MSEHLDMYLEGFRKGDAEMILRALADDFVYDDPVGGRFTKAEFAAYLGELLGALRGRPARPQTRSSRRSATWSEKRRTARKRRGAGSRPEPRKGPA